MEFHYIFSKSLRMAYPQYSPACFADQSKDLIHILVFNINRFVQTHLSSSRISAGQDDSTVFYLISSCGLSPEAAIVASHKVKLQSLEEPNSVLALLRRYEFSNTQISTLVRKHPHILVADAKKTLVPKLEFFCSIGISRLDLARTLTYNHIVPNYSFVKGVVLSDVQSTCQPCMHLYGKETTWKRCQEAYRRWSWSENHIRSAFRLCPLCMVMSEKKIMGIMNKMGWHSQKTAKYPNVLCYSLEKRFIPRF
ncbi:putative transcription regulator mTERF family [Rosa chinensis]|uniref:Putative transcription regulator mTERF family n=1 Tax=Rosa chinensis TaxID=74649 RepID=A0A2P6PWJ3_ROSCH|nr:putative transcription regulator mTERF family [Rosa chinensis]